MTRSVPVFPRDTVKYPNRSKNDNELGKSSKYMFLRRIYAFLLPTKFSKFTQNKRLIAVQAVQQHVDAYFCCVVAGVAFALRDGCVLVRAADVERGEDHAFAVAREGRLSSLTAAQRSNTNRLL